jgi:hypothetical protein
MLYGRGAGVSERHIRGASPFVSSGTVCPARMAEQCAPACDPLLPFLSGSQCSSCTCLTDHFQEIVPPSSTWWLQTGGGISEYYDSAKQLNFAQR